MVFRKYSPECKFAAVRAALDGKNLAEINRSLGAQISQDSLYRWTSLYKRTQAVVCDPSTYLPRGRPFDLNDEDLQFIEELLTDKPTMYVDEIQRALIEQHGISVSMTNILKCLHNRLQMSKKTIRKVNPRQDPDERALYISNVAFIPSSCLFFTDETGVSLEAVAQTRGWAQIGQRTPQVPRERSTHGYNVIPAISTSGLVAHMVQEESVDHFTFELFLENMLAPEMLPFPLPKSVLVMDNAQIHHNGRVAEILESQGCLLLYLPPYSPDLNPIKKGFSIYKLALKQFEQLLTGGDKDYDVINKFVCLVFTSDIIKKLFQGSGYAV